jgi:hypothetical protein
MTTVEEINARLALDISSVQRNTQLMLDQQKKASMEYVDFWQSATAKREASEAAANDRSLARLKAHEEAKLAAQRQFFEKQAAMYREREDVAGVGNGSVPVGWKGTAGNAAGAAAATLAGGGSLTDAAWMAGTMAAGGVGSHLGEKAAGHLAKSTIVREVMVLIREGLRGNFTRMIGSFTILADALGATATTFLSAIPIVGAGVAAVLDGLRRRKLLATDFGLEGKGGYNELFDKDEAKLGSHLNKIVAKLSEQGLLSGPEGTEVSRRLSAGGMDNILVAQQLLRRMFPGGISGMSYDTKIEDAARDASRVGMSPQARWMDTTNELMRTMTAMNVLDKNSAAYKAEQLKYERLLKEQAEDNLAIQKETAEQQKKAADDKKKAQDEEKQRQKELADLEHQRQQLIIRQQGETQRENMEFPTLEQLARARVWGGYRVGWQRTDQGQIAHDILFLQQRQLHEREWGDISGANRDAGEIGRLKGILQNEGYMAQGSRLDAIHSELQNLNARIDKTLNVNIAGVNGS